MQQKYAINVYHGDNELFYCERVAADNRLFGCLRTDVIRVSEKETSVTTVWERLASIGFKPEHREGE